MTMRVPPLKPGLVPQFHEIDPDTFEDLCRDLVQEEEGVVAADRYGTLGQRQYGVDLLIDRSDGSLWVGQCKSNKECDENLIRAACDAFLNHADFWSGKGVTKFVLFLAADTRRRQLHDERLRQRDRLRNHGFTFTVWSAAVLKSKLRKNRAIVRHFLPFLENYLCGLSHRLEIASTQQTVALLNLASQYGERVAGEHARLLRLWQEGRPKEALRKLRAVRTEMSSLGTLVPLAEAKLVHLEGRLLVATGDVLAAKKLVVPTPMSDVSGHARLLAMIAQAEDRLGDAIAALATQDDTDSQTLRAAIHLQKGEGAAAAKILSQLDSHPEARRLRAIVFVACGDVTKAKLEAERALDLEPSWYWMKRTAATIRYLAGLSPVIIPKGLPEWPAPILESLVRQDEEAVMERRSAAAEFEALCAQPFDHDTNDIACFDTWRVACLVDDPSSRREAATIAAASLEARPENYRVVLWVLARGLEVSIERSVQMLQERVDRGESTFEESIALVAAYAATDDAAMAAEVLGRTSETIPAERERERDAIGFWRSRLGRVEEKSSTTLASVRARADDAVARLRAATDDEDQLACWDEYMILAQLGHWDEVAAAAGQLISVFKTPDAARLACHALYNVGDGRACIAMLRRARTVFFNGELSFDLRQLEVAVQRDVGALPDAIRAVRDVLEETGAAEAFMELARLYLQVGDLKNIAVLARRYDEVGGLKSADYLTLASCLKVEDRVLALKLWEEAIAEGVPDEHVGLAFEIGNSLVADKYLDTLARRLAELGQTGRGGVERVGVAELLERMRARHRHLQDLSEMLRCGTLPVHLFSKATGIALVTIFRRFRLVAQANVDKEVSVPTYQRFGGRTPAPHRTVEGQDWRLNADITAILNAAHFGLLARIEAAYGPIRIPQQILLVLSAIQHALRPNQPDRIDATRRIVDLEAGGLLRRIVLEPVVARASTDGDVADDVLAALRHVSKSGGFVVGFLPPRSIDAERAAASVPDRYLGLLRDGHSVVDALLKCAAVTGKQYGVAIGNLGQRPQLPSEEVIQRGAQLVCDVGVLVLLNAAGVLEAAASTFDLAITKEDVEWAKEEIRKAAEDEADARWVGELVEGIREGLEAGRYEFLPRVRDRGMAPKDGEQSDIEMMLGDLLRCDGRDGDVIWIDDRCLNSHGQSEGKRIVDTVDLLYDLRRKDQLSEEELFENLTEIRGADSRFVAFSAEELLTAIRAAPVQDGVVVETKQLRILRRYYARCLLDADALRAPAGDAEKPGEDTEWHFLMECGRAVLLALVRVWHTGTTEEREARANWLLDYLFTEDRGFHGTSSSQTTEASVHATALAIAGLMTGAVELDLGDPERSARHSYFAWLDRRILRNQLDVDPILEVTVVGQLRGVLAESAEATAEVDRTTARALMARLWIDLPRRIRDLTVSDQEFARRLNITGSKVVSIGPLEVETRTLWSTLASVLNNGIATDLKTVDGQEITLALISSEPIVFSIQCPSARVDVRLRNQELLFLSNALEVRESGAAQVAHLFDLPAEERDELIARVVAGQDPASRMDAVSAACASSGVVFYRDLEAGLQAGRHFHHSEIMPVEPLVLVRHLRIDESDAPSLRWERAVGRLLEDVGIVETAVRIGGLPVKTPAVFVDAVSRLATDEREGTLRSIRRIWSQSPIGVVRIAEMWTQVLGGQRRAARVRERVACVLCDTALRETFEAWRAVLQWVHEGFGFDRGLRSFPTDVRLGCVWTHADRVFRILAGRGLSNEWISSVFKRNNRALPPEFVFPEYAYGDDVAAPQFTTAETLALAGLGCISVDADGVRAARRAFEESFMRMEDAERTRVLRTIMADASGATNSLQSWLVNGGRTLAFLPEELQVSLSEQSLTAAALASCREIKNGNGKEVNWVNLLLRFGHHTPAARTLVTLEECARVVDIIDLARRNPILARGFVDAMGLQAARLSDDCRRLVVEKLVELAGELAEIEMAENDRNELLQSMLSTVVVCAWSEGDGRGHALAEALERVLTVFRGNAFERPALGFVLGVCSALPVEHAKHFWRVRDILRERTTL